MPLFLTVAVIVYAVLCRLYLLCEWTELAIIVSSTKLTMDQAKSQAHWVGRYPE